MKIVIVEDDPDIVDAVSLYLEIRWPDLVVISSVEGVAGIELVRNESPDLVILDIGLPDIDGFEVIRRIRRFSDVSIVVLSARDGEMDKVKALELGGDDYVTKPFSQVELLARIKAILRRSVLPNSERGEKPMIIGRLWIDFDAREVRADGKRVNLSRTEYNLLSHLARNAGRVIPHTLLREKVWGSDYDDATDYLKVYIRRLRVKLHDDGDRPRMIVLKRGEGYILAKPSQFVARSV